MQRLLLARECGDEAYGLDDILSARWTALSADPKRKYRAKYCESLSFIDLERPGGSLILCGGETSLDYGNPSSACVGIHQYAEAGKQSESAHLVHHIYDRAPDSVAFSCGRWFPYDSAIFVTGTTSKGEVIIWDTERFSPVTNFELGTESAIIATEMSYAPGARTELIAVARNDSLDLTLIDMASGASTHRLQSHNFPLRGVAWAPINPHLVASVDSGGSGFLFDIRRSGNTACLVHFDQSRRIPTYETVTAKRERVCKDVGHEQLPERQGCEEASLLGLSCVWNRRARGSMKKKRKRGSNSAGTNAQGPALGRVRFSPDGSFLVTADIEGILRVWDAFTGRLITMHDTAASIPGQNNANWNGTFEISRDALHVLSSINGNLLTLDVEEGYVVNYSETSNYSEMKDLTLHPLYEEVLSIERDSIICWSPGESECKET